MRRVNWPFAVGLIITVAAAAGGFHALHVARYGQIADDLRLQVGRGRDDGRPDDAIKFAAQYLDFRPADVGMMADLAGWLREHRLLTGDAPVTAADLDNARRLRAVLRDSTRQPQPGQATGRAGDVTTTLTAFPLLASAGPGTGIRLTPPGEGADAALTRVLITAAELSVRGLWARLKMCPATDCQWIFFDRSRPGRGRWCSPDLCGNRQKKRAQRQRQGQGHPGRLEVNA